MNSQYKDSKKTVIQIGVEKKIGNVLLGSVEKQGKDIILQLELIYTYFHKLAFANLKYIRSPC